MSGVEVYRQNLGKPGLVCASIGVVGTLVLSVIPAIYRAPASSTNLGSVFSHFCMRLVDGNMWQHLISMHYWLHYGIPFAAPWLLFSLILFLLAYTRNTSWGTAGVVLTLSWLGIVALKSYYLNYNIARRDPVGGAFTMLCDLPLLVILFAFVLAFEKILKSDSASQRPRMPEVPPASNGAESNHPGEKLVFYQNEQPPPSPSWRAQLVYTITSLLVITVAIVAPAFFLGFFETRPGIVITTINVASWMFFAGALYALIHTRSITWRMGALYGIACCLLVMAARLTILYISWINRGPILAGLSILVPDLVFVLIFLAPLYVYATNRRANRMPSAKV